MHDLPVSRRRFLGGALHTAGLAGAAALLPLPAWARAISGAITDVPARDHYALTIGATGVDIGGRHAQATGINGSVPGPLVRLREGSRVVLDVANRLGDDSSIHWHGLLLPSNMDGVPGLSFDGIAPGGSYRYEFTVRQHGTYWYHSHSGLQEQTGVYGPLVIDPAGTDPVEYDREFVVLLSDWSFESPERIFRNLKVDAEYYNRQPRKLRDSFDEWSVMRMSRNDIADVTGMTYTYLLNGHDNLAGWTGIFEPGERVRLRIINGSAMSFFNVRIPGLAMQVMQADGQDVEPVETDEFQIGVAETYDVVVWPGDRAYTLMAESMDRSGYVAGTLAPRAGMRAEVPPLREPPQLEMRDMGMDHGAMDGMSGHAHHHGHGGGVAHDHRAGPGVDNLNASPLSRLDEPGVGLEKVGHRALCYADLRSLEPNDDDREPGRILELHLTGNMHRYMWSFDGVKFSEVTGPIRFSYGERLRMVLVNDTMMAHPIHLHGMFVELVNGNGIRNPRKHTVVVKPAERLAVDVTADEPGKWAFHCHLLYHMKGGMMRVVHVPAPEVAS